MLMLLKSWRASSLVGLALEGGQLAGGLLQRTGAGPRLTRTCRAALSLDPLTNDPELVGREIRNQLEEAGIHERRCTICVPLQWALSLQTKVPEIPEADVASFLQLEAERGFPYAPADLAIATSRYRAPNGEQHATLIAIPKAHLARLEQCLRAGGLKPQSFSLGISVLRESADTSADTLLTLAIAETCVEMQVCIQGGVVALRTLEGALETEGAQKHLDAEGVAREVRITLGQLPKELRELVSRIRVYGRRELAGRLVKEIGPLAQDMGLLVDSGQPPRLEGYDPEATDQGSTAAAVNLAARLLAGQPPAFEFLPPRISPLAQLRSKFSSAKVMYASATVGAVSLAVGSLFLWQSWELSAQESTWRTMQPRVKEVENLKQQTRRFRAWYDPSVRSLRILRGLTEAFPEDGSVWVKSVKVKDLNEITLSGLARDNDSINRLQEQLSKVPQVDNLKISNVRANAKPMQFDLSFNWGEGVSREN